MSRKIKFHAFHILFRLFAFLADKSGGWRVFVRPKLLLGSVIVGLSISPVDFIQAQKKEKDQNKTENESGVVASTDSISHELCYEVVVIKKQATNHIYTTIDQMPQFPGGDVQLLLFISKNMTMEIPTAQCYNGISGKVICRFVVEKDGSLSNITVVRSLDNSDDKEAVRIIKKMPKWIPGKLNGKVVRVYYTLPIKFNPEY